MLYKSVPSVESIKLMKIIFGKMGQNGKVKFRNLLLNYLRYRYSDQIIIDKECNRIKVSFKE